MKDLDREGRLRIGREAVGKAKADAAIRRTVAGLKTRAKESERERKAFKETWTSDMRIVERALGKLISKDDTSSRAAARLRELREVPIEGRADLGWVRDQASMSVREETLFGPHLHRNVHVIGPPYDYGWEWGNPQEPRNNPATGEIGVKGHSKKLRDCAAGVGIVLTTDKPGKITVRPYITNYWQISMGGWGLGAWADARGGIDAAAFEQGAIINPPGVRWNETFSWYQPSGEIKNSNSHTVASASQLTLEFGAVPGKIYSVNFGAWISIASSDGWYIGLAGTHALSQGWVQFVVVELSSV